MDYRTAEIYVIRNVMNDRVHIGATFQRLSQRMTEYRKKANANVEGPLFHDMRVHGNDKFHIYRLRQVQARDRMELETYVQEAMQAFDPYRTYNVMRD